MYPDPRTALAVFVALAAASLALAWPRRGLLARWRRMRHTSERARVEDALKYLFHRGAEGLPVYAAALAGALHFGQQAAREMLERLATNGLVEAAGTSAFRLTDRGRADALRIVRSHRLVEHYLADRTGIGPEEWHELAEEEEHLLT